VQQDRFVQAHRDEWQALRRLLDRLEQRARDDVDALPDQCRRVSQHLSLARHRGYSADLVDRLHDLAMRSHQQLYRRRLGAAEQLRDLLLYEVPRTVRRQWPLVLIAHLLFYGSALATGLAIVAEPSRVFAVIDPLTLGGIEEMYDPASEFFLKERQADSDLLMFGYYIWNNVGIGFRTFASGALLGLGPVFFLSYNGVQMGAIFAHLANIDRLGTLTSFVVGHGSFELTAIVLAGAAGGRLGLAWLLPGRSRRTVALRRAAGDALPIIGGAGLMLVVAAVIEAFWSSTTLIPPGVKYTVGAALWALVYAWLLLGGRRGHR